MLFIYTAARKRISVDAFYHGNADSSDAKKASQIISEAMTSNCNHVGIPKKKLPTKFVIKAPLVTDHHRVIAPTLDTKDPNTAVEVYFQMGKDDLLNRVLIDLLAQVLDEPLFCQLRTHEAFGYEVSCGARWTYGVLGMSFNVVTACKSAVRFMLSYFVVFEAFSPLIYVMIFYKHISGGSKPENR